MRPYSKNDMENARRDDRVFTVDTVPAMAWASDPDGLRIHFNRSWLAFTGRTLEQELGEGWVNGIHPDDRQRCRDICRSSVTSRQPFKIEYRLRRADGQFRWVLSHGEPRFSDRGVFEGHVGSCLDITERKSADEMSSRLRDSEQGMRFCLEAANIGTWDWDIESGSVRWSENMEKIHGQLPGSFGGNFEAFLKGIRSEDHQRVSDAVRQALEGDGKYSVEYRQVNADGSFGWMEAHGQVIYDSSNRPKSMMGVCRDISERKRSEEALRDAHEQLEARVRERTAELDHAQERLRILSARLLQMQDDERRRIARELHDTAGQILVALNLNLVPVEEELRKTNSGLVAQIGESLRLIEELSRDLRTMSHLLHPPLLDEAGLQSAVRWYVEGFAERSKIAVDLRLDPELGRLPAELETAMFRTVQECLTNIHRHSGSNSASIAITGDTHHVTIEIRDQGKGMSMPIRAGVGIQGMGERVRQLRGHLEIQSGSGGTRVTAVFPTNVASSEVSPEMSEIAS